MLKQIKDLTKAKKIMGDLALGKELDLSEHKKFLKLLKKYSKYSQEIRNYLNNYEKAVREKEEKNKNG